MKEKRPTNQELCAAFRELLTHGCPQDMREKTKPWRNDVWRAFGEIEERMCPTPQATRKRMAKEKE